MVTHTHTYIHTYIHTYTHTYIYTYTHTYIYTYTRTIQTYGPAPHNRNIWPYNSQATAAPSRLADSFVWRGEPLHITTILFSTHRKLEPLHKGSVLVDDTIIPQVKSTKFLGVYIIDQHLTWNDHIKHISLKIAKLLE